MKRTTLVHNFQCVTGWVVPDVHWEGVRLSDVLERAGVTNEATALRFFSADGVYTESLTLAQAQRPDILVADKMLGANVTTDHGGPVRLVRRAHVRLQVDQVAQPHRSHQQDRGRLLGGRGLPGRRLDRRLRSGQRRSLSCRDPGPGNDL